MTNRIFQIKPILELIALAGHNLYLCDRSIVAPFDLDRGIPTQVALQSCIKIRGYVVDQERAVRITGGSITSGEFLAYIVAQDWPAELKSSHQIIFNDSTYQIEEQQRIRDHVGEILLFIKLKSTQDSDRSVFQPDSVIESEYIDPRYE